MTLIDTIRSALSGAGEGGFIAKREAPEVMAPIKAAEENVSLTGETGQEKPEGIRLDAVGQESPKKQGSDDVCPVKPGTTETSRKRSGKGRFVKVSPDIAEESDVFGDAVGEKSGLPRSAVDDASGGAISGVVAEGSHPPADSETTGHAEDDAPPETRLPPSGSSKTVKPHDATASKSDQVLKRLRDVHGASIVELTELTGWQAHSVRGFLSGTVRKKLGLALVSDTGLDRVRRYRIEDGVDVSALTGEAR